MAEKQIKLRTYAFCIFVLAVQSTPIGRKDQVLPKSSESVVLDKIIGAWNGSESTETAVESRTNDNTQASQHSSIYDIAAKLNVKKFLELSERAYLQPLLNGKGPYTLFAPTDDALANLDPNDLERLSKNSDAIEEFILNHIVRGTYSSDMLRIQRSLSLKSIAGSFIAFRKSKRDDGKYFVNGIELGSSRDITGTNGVIHTINGILFFPNMSNVNEDDSEDDGLQFVTDVVVTGKWTIPDSLNEKKGVTISTDGSYDGYGPSSINPNDYMPAEEGHVEAIEQVVKQWRETSKAS